MKLKKIETLWRKIPVDVPVDGTGSQREHITVKYPILPQSEVDEMIADNDDNATSRRIFLGFKHIDGEDDKPLEDTAEHRDMILDIGYIKASIIHGFFKMHNGGKAKN